MKSTDSSFWGARNPICGLPVFGSRLNFAPAGLLHAAFRSGLSSVGTLPGTIVAAGVAPDKLANHTPHRDSSPRVLGCVVASIRPRSDSKKMIEAEGDARLFWKGLGL